MLGIRTRYTTIDLHDVRRKTEEIEISCVDMLVSSCRAFLTCPNPLEADTSFFDALSTIQKYIPKIELDSTCIRVTRVLFESLGMLFTNEE